MNLFTNAIEKKVTVIFVTAYPIYFVIIVVIIAKKSGFVQIIGKNMQ